MVTAFSVGSSFERQLEGFVRYAICRTAFGGTLEDPLDFAPVASNARRKVVNHDAVRDSVSRTSKMARSNVRDRWSSCLGGLRSENRGSAGPRQCTDRDCKN
jgi:hypothetical protein